MLLEIIGVVEYNYCSIRAIRVPCHCISNIVTLRCHFEIKSPTAVAMGQIKQEKDDDWSMILTGPEVQIACNRIRF